MQHELQSHHEAFIETPDLVEAGLLEDLAAETSLADTEQLSAHRGLLRRLGSAAMRQLEFARLYGPVAYISAHLDNSTERASSLAVDHPKVVAATAGIAVGSLGVKFGYDMVHQVMIGHSDLSAFATTHAPAQGAETLHNGMPMAQHAELTSFNVTGTHHSDLLHATSPSVAKDYSNLPHSASYDFSVMQSDAARAQAAGDLRVVYPDGYLPSGQPVNPDHFWYAVKETVTQNGRHEVIWTTNIHQVLPTLAAHSDGARAFSSTAPHHRVPRHNGHPNSPRQYHQPAQPPTSEPSPVVTAPEHSDSIWRHRKVLALAVGSVGAALTANVLVWRRLKKPATEPASPIERVVPESASAQLIRSMESHGIIEVFGRHGAPVALDEQDASIMRPRIGTADFSTMASTTISALASPDQSGIVTLRLSMTDGRRIGTPLVDHSQASAHNDGTTTGYIALTCTIDRNVDTQPCVLQGITESGQLEDLSLGERPTAYYVNLLTDILAKDIANATSKKKKERQLAQDKVTLAMAS